MQLPSGLAFGFFRPPSCISSKAKATLWTWESRRQSSRTSTVAHFRVSRIHLLFEALGGEEEVVQRDKIIFKQPHQQHQVDAVGKLHKATASASNHSPYLKTHIELNPPGASYLRFQLRHLQVQLVQVFVDEGDERLEIQLTLVISHSDVSSASEFKGSITVFTTFSLSGAWSSSVSKASLSVGTNKCLTQSAWRFSFMSTCREFVNVYLSKEKLSKVLLENKMCLGLTKSPHHHSEKDRERQWGGGGWNLLCVKLLHLDAKAPALTLWCSSALLSRGRSAGFLLVSAQIKTKWANLRLSLTIYRTLTLTTTTCTDTCSGSLMGAWKCIARSTSR